MLTVKIKAYTKGLVYKNNKYIRMLDEGRHWLNFNEDVIVYDMHRPFAPADDLSIYLNDSLLADALEVVDVKDNEIALKFENGLFKAVLPAGRYAFWKGMKELSFIKADVSKYEITEPIDRLILARPELLPYLRIYTVESYEQGLLFVDGKFASELKPGIYYFWKNPIVLTVYKADIRQLQLEMNGQEILTKDKASLRINFTVQYKITNVVKASENKEYEKQLYTLMQLALRELVAGYTLDELLDKRDAVSKTILDNVQDSVLVLGVVVLNCGIRDIILPGDVKDIMNQVLIAEKNAQANIIMRREETASTRSLLNTARLMEDNEMLFKLKEMEYVEKIADKINTLSVTGSGDLVGQLKEIFVPAKK
ncbi:slipin family protein [Polluticoccus soli]|uniref:slipin family protein n=1 Tax=Polluticoccus soli TaxID=3034150 RepID=UPI0023E0AE92|nr:slipin family protein [Flavipsychrobacter sp. JY13-12]